jgi:hypothetical protein
MALAVIVVAGLGLWMLLLGRAFERAESGAPSFGFQSDIYGGTFSLSNQATVINFLLLATPCFLGLVFGAPLVASELEHHTNRVAWTQGVSRTKWLMVKWFVVGLSLLTIVVLLTLVTQWWTGHIVERLNFVDAIGAGAFGGRLQPTFFPITGIAFSAYTLFAFALGTALGAVIRKTSWAVVGTLVTYIVVSVVAVLFVRPSLAPQLFVYFQQGQQTSATITREIVDSWDLGFGYRYAPGTHETGPSADVVAQRCEVTHYPEPPYLTCIAQHHIQAGNIYQPGNHYWELQRRESALLLFSSGALLGVAVWSVRRWTA